MRVRSTDCIRCCTFADILSSLKWLHPWASDCCWSCSIIPSPLQSWLILTHINPAGSSGSVAVVHTTNDSLSEEEGDLRSQPNNSSQYLISPRNDRQGKWSIYIREVSRLFSPLKVTSKSGYVNVCHSVHWSFPLLQIVLTQWTIKECVQRPKSWSLEVWQS